MSINYHFWPICNLKCKYCFARFQNISFTPKIRTCFEIVRKLSEFGFKKINFVGGEPTLCPFLGKILVHSKKLGFTTSFITNGISLTHDFINHYSESTDWIGISIDSSYTRVHNHLGRGSKVKSLIQKCLMVKKVNIKLKINSVITRLDVNEDMSKIIEKINPDRWKIFQVLAIEGQNNENMKDLKINKMEFMDFIRRHEKFNPIAEDNDAMLESYIMVDPMGRFYQNSGKIYNYSKPILEVGVLRAFNQIIYNHTKFIERGGIYAY